MQLDDGPAHERVRREGVGAVAPAIDHEHPMTGAREQHRGGRAGAARTDDDDVL
jgi:hypothetical protein